MVEVLDDEWMVIACFLKLIVLPKVDDLLSHGDKGAISAVGLINFQHRNEEVLFDRTSLLPSPSPMLSVMIL